MVTCTLEQMIDGLSLLRITKLLRVWLRLTSSGSSTLG